MIRIILFTFSFLTTIAWAEPSQCYGTTSNGSLSDGVKLPHSGDNFVGYSFAARVAGRTYVHSEVKSIIIDSYRSLELTEPNKIYKYAETGFKAGGKFKPHKTHQNGLSVDFMVPVMNKSGRSVHLPTNALNKLGYNIEFNAKNQYKIYSIDFDALAAHLVELHKHALKHGHDIWRVIFAPELQPNLYKTKYGEYLRKHIQFSKQRSWVRHDEHYHVDFEVSCK